MDKPAPTSTKISELAPGGANSARGRKYLALFLNRLADAGHEPAAEFLEVDKSTVTRLKNEHLEKVCDLAAFLGLKVVPQELQCYRAEDIEPLLKLAKQRMESLESVDQLSWDDDD